MLSRRSILKSAALLVPTWRLAGSIVEFDLEKFCDHDDYICRYDCSKPFTQCTADFPYRYATDARICLRVPEGEQMNVEPIANEPPAASLPWTHNERGGWRSWPTRQYLFASGTTCPHCEGRGYRIVDGVYGPKCDECFDGEGVFPSLQPIGGQFIDKHYDHLIRSQLGECEWRCIEKPTMPVSPWSGHVVQFRFRGGEGLLMTQEHEKAKARMQKG